MAGHRQHCGSSRILMTRYLIIVIIVCLNIHSSDRVNMYTMFIIYFGVPLWDIYKQYRSRSDVGGVTSAQVHYCLLQNSPILIQIKCTQHIHIHIYTYIYTFSILWRPFCGTSSNIVDPDQTLLLWCPIWFIIIILICHNIHSTLQI